MKIHLVGKGYMESVICYGKRRRKQSTRGGCEEGGQDFLVFQRNVERVKYDFSRK